VPELAYDDLAVADGGAASLAYVESIETADAARRAELQGQLVAYCERDTLAMVELRRVLGEAAGRRGPRRGREGASS
jgi:hypothetical protein